MDKLIDWFLLLNGYEKVILIFWTGVALSSMFTVKIYHKKEE